MQATKINEQGFSECGTITTDGLQAYLHCGRKTALEVGTSAKARIKVGRRVLWNMEKIRAYLNTISD